MDASPMGQQTPMGDASSFGNMPPMPPQGQDMPPMDNEPMPEDNPEPQPQGSEIDDIYNQLSPDDQKATKSYAQSLLNRDEEAQEQGNATEAPENGNPQPPMAEIYRKVNGRLVKENCEIGLGNSDCDDEDSSRKPLGKKIAVRSKSPFSSPIKK